MSDSSPLLELYVASKEAFNGQHWRSNDPASVEVSPTTITHCNEVLQRQLLHLRKVLEVAGLAQSTKEEDTTTPTITYLLDIEGTTTPLPFVTKVLFPFAEAQLESWVCATLSSSSSTSGNGSEGEEVVLLKQCISEAQQDPQNKELFEGGSVGTAFVAACKARMVENSKVGYLKKVQGYLWRSAYETRKIKGHVLPDAVDAIRTWSSSSSSVQIYSSGSIPAQKLLFGFSSAGDLTPHLTGYYDPSTVGGKAEASSYTNIRKAIPTSSKIIFITDSLLEVEAAVTSKDIDLIIFSLRPMNAPDLNVQRLVELGIPVVSSFSIITAAMNGEGGTTHDGVVETLWREVQQYRDVGNTQLKIFS